jgi:hypothetical protein
MNIHSLFENQFDDVCGQANGTGCLLLPTADGDLQCDVSQANPIACRLERLSYYSERIGGASPESLEQLGRELSQRVNYLSEPLTLTEIDRESAGVQLRSSPPQRDEENVRYFELSITCTRGLQLQRYLAPRGESRQASNAPMTRETLERLARDCIDSTREVLG